MGDFPAVRQLVAEAVSPVLRLRGGGVEAEAPSPAPAPPLRSTTYAAKSFVLQQDISTLLIVFGHRK